MKKFTITILAKQIYDANGFLLKHFTRFLLTILLPMAGTILVIIGKRSFTLYMQNFIKLNTIIIEQLLHVSAFCVVSMTINQDKYFT